MAEKYIDIAKESTGQEILGKIGNFLGGVQTP